MSMPVFQGTPQQQELATEVFQLMTMQGSFFAHDAPIRQSLANLADFLAVRTKADSTKIAKDIEAALNVNTEIFQREDREGEIVYITARKGVFAARSEDMSHTFKQRLFEPANPLPVDDITVVVSTSRPPMVAAEPIFISDYWRDLANGAPSANGDGYGETATGPEAAVEEPMAAAAEPAVLKATEHALLAEEPTTPAPVTTEPVAAEVPVFATSTPAVVAEVVAEAPAQPAAPVTPVTPAAPAQEAALPVGSNFALPDGTSIDLSFSNAELLETYGAQLKTLLSEQLDQDALRRIVNFGTRYYTESAVASLGKNDLRRIRDLILEMGEPLPDTTILSDLYHTNAKQSDYESFRFALNYRLSREKDFDFVGVEGAYLWSVKGLPVIGSKRIKTGDMAQLTAYLTEGYDDSLSMQSAETIRESGSLSHVLTFFEWEYGILPLDAALSALLPAPMTPEQRSVVLRIESTQHYTQYLVEARYPTVNRGGWLQGLEEFFRDHLVPGALITLTRAAEPNVFVISYEEAESAEERLLSLDEKKNRLSFAPISYAVVVDEDFLPAQSRYGKIKNLKLFPMNDRRKLDQMVGHVAETMGAPVGTRENPAYRVTLQELLVGMNVLRPASMALIRANAETHSDFTPDAEETYVYRPPMDEEAEEAESIFADTDDDDE